VFTSSRLLPASRRFAALALALVVAFAASCTPSKKKPEKPSVSRVVGKIGKSAAEEILLERATVAAFYKARNHRSAWPDDASIASMRGAIAAIALDGLRPDDYHLERIDTLIARLQVRGGASEAFDPDLDVLLSDAAAAMIDDARYGRVSPFDLDTTWNVDPRKDANPLVDALKRVAKAPTPAEGVENEKLDQSAYRGLKEELARLYDVSARGGWPEVAAGAPIKPKSRDGRVPSLRDRLLASGDLTADEAAAIADSLLYDGALVAAVRRFQTNHLLTAEGRIGAGTLRELNRSVEKRIDEVRVNLERARWVAPALGSDFLLVNLPAFHAYLVRGDTLAWEARTQIGQEARRTPSFRARMTFLDINPTWTVPPTVLKEDVLHGAAPPESMLVRKHLHVYDTQWRPIAPESINWKKVDPEKFPYLLRADPGEFNALGRVKFMFPNKYDIYLHDTPSRSQFDAEKRTFSSGCIRIDHPIELAKIVLEPNGFDSTYVDTVIAGGRTTRVGLKKPVPVFIVYWTVSVDPTGAVQYAPDVYGIDPKVLAVLNGEDPPASEKVAAKTKP
jgi:murein L,D-transpeptidase YcbB/YkuD